jgi:hypothetical protein
VVDAHLFGFFDLGRVPKIVALWALTIRARQPLAIGALLLSFFPNLEHLEFPNDEEESRCWPLNGYSPFGKPLTDNAPCAQVFSGLKKAKRLRVLGPYLHRLGLPFEQLETLELDLRGREGPLRFPSSMGTLHSDYKQVAPKSQDADTPRQYVPCSRLRCLLIASGAPYLSTLN